MSDLFLVFFYALLTALATGLGALPFAFIKKITPRVISFANAIAAGLMLGASITLIVEGTTMNFIKSILGMLFGIFAIYFYGLLDEKFSTQRDFHFIKKMKISPALKSSFLLIIVMTMHSVAEGIGIGTSFAGDMKFGIIMALAIAVHNIPEGIAVSATLVGKGMSWKKASFWSIFTSLPQPIFALPAYIFISSLRSYVPFGLGFAAGAMLWILFSDIVPESQEYLSEKTSATIISFGTIAMLLFQFLF